MSGVCCMGCFCYLLLPKAEPRIAGQGVGFGVSGWWLQVIERSRVSIPRLGVGMKLSDRVYLVIRQKSYLVLGLEFFLARARYNFLSSALTLRAKGLKGGSERLHFRLGSFDTMPLCHSIPKFV